MGKDEREDEIPVELLQLELAGMESELRELRQQHKTVTDRIVELERERFAIDCKIRSQRKRMSP